VSVVRLQSTPGIATIHTKKKTLGERQKLRAPAIVSNLVQVLRKLRQEYCDSSVWFCNCPDKYE